LKVELENDKFYQKLIEEFGEFKKVTDAVTGKSYKVPTLHICRFGLKYEELKNFPEWSD
jgi:hypothetical protein